MDNPFIWLGVFVFLSIWYLDRSLKNWKTEQDAKVDDIKNTVDRIETYLEEKFD